VVAAIEQADGEACAAELDVTDAASVRAPLRDLEADASLPDVIVSAVFPAVVACRAGGRCHAARPSSRAR